MVYRNVFNIIQQKKYGGGYDVLKFIMAVLVVAIHTQAFHGPWSYIYLKPITAVAVPFFFILSSFFYFKKIYSKEFNWIILTSFIRRMGFLYIFWFLVNLPFIFKTHHYFVDNAFTDVPRFLGDVFLRYTFPGSWFFSATTLAIILYTLVYRSKLLRYTFLFLSIILYFYINCIKLLPTNFQ